MYSDKVEVLRFETEPYRKQLNQNGTPVGKQNGSLNYKYSINNNNNDSLKHIIFKNGYQHALVYIEITNTHTQTIVIYFPDLVGTVLAISRLLLRPYGFCC